MRSVLSSADRRRRVLRWSRLVMDAAAVLALTAVVVLTQARLYSAEPGPTDVVAQLRFLGQELRSGAGERMQRYFPEGYFFSHVLYGLAWTEVARAEPSYRQRALEQSRWALVQLESTSGTAVFDSNLRPRYGVFYAGWSSRLRGAVVELAGPAAPEAARLGADCAELAASFEADGPFLPAYPRQAWPVDSVVAVAALRMHDRVLEPRFGAVVEHWTAAARARLDPATGLLPHRVLPVVEGARGSSQSLIQRFLPEVDKDWAGEQYRLFRSTFAARPLGLPAVREYPHGGDGEGDVDSGPLLFGASLSASVVALGAARVHGDRSLAGPLTGLGEALGVPVSVGSGKRYGFGMFPVGDAFLAWSYAAPQAPDGTFGAVVGWWWRLPWHALGLAVLGLLWLPVLHRHRRWDRTRRGRRAIGPGVGEQTGEQDDTKPY
ncbi:hypothetical protein OH799_17175 [Nocardia sp. NBC_00881]|uniref:hypothetical protein n=1 Tax=Nocardia sp. NBC_00881 TaxID=2975995 RepID=UPI00386B2012|nr:hypothetical protein OH799_17175 [Nocardia sp. NBC_00881]